MLKEVQAWNPGEGHTHQKGRLGLLRDGLVLGSEGGLQGTLGISLLRKKLGMMVHFTKRKSQTDLTPMAWMNRVACSVGI